MILTEPYHPNQQAQFPNVVLENNTKDPFSIPTGILGHIDFAPGKNELDPPPQLYIVYKQLQDIQTILSKMYPDTFEVHYKSSPITDHPPNYIPIYDVTQVSLNIPPETSSQIKKPDHEYQYFLHKFIFTYCQLSTQELFNVVQWLCEIQDVHSQHENDFSVIDLPFHITLEPDAELRKQRITKVPFHYRDQRQQVLDD